MDKNILNNCKNDLFIQSISSFNKSLDQNIENNDILKSVKRLLSSFQSVSKRYSGKQMPTQMTSNHILSEQMTKCLTKLEEIVLLEESFAETSVLSGLAIAFALNIYLCDTEKAIHLYFKLFTNQSIVSIDINNYKIDSNLSDILSNVLTDNYLTRVSLLSALLNCNYFIDYLIEFESKILIQIHSQIINICGQRLVHQFHVFKLLQHWFKAFNNNIKRLALNEPNFFNDKIVITNTLIQIDNNWEHPINGVKDCIKVIYKLLLETFTTFKNFVSINCGEKHPINSYDLIAEEVLKTSRLALTSKAKYRKMSALISFTNWKTVLERDPNLSTQMFKYLSINSLSTSIIELYKVIIISMKMDRNEDILSVWSEFYLESMCCALKSKNKVIHNNTTAHLLPFTLKNIENSTQVIYENVINCPIAEVAVVRSAVDLNIALEFSEPFSWLKSVVINSEEMVREEALSLIVDERYISDRNKVFELFELFLLSNLNVDNPSFRQTIISKIEKFITKICISLSDKFGLYASYDESDQKSVQFLKNYSNIIVSNLISGASFQRRTTSLLLFESLLMTTSKCDSNLNNYLDLNDTYFLVFISIIDKDDKIRKIASNLLINFYKTYGNSIDYSFDKIAEIGLKFLNSPRHQESHSGALIMRFIIHCFKNFRIDGKMLLNELEVIEYFLRSAQKQFELSKQNSLFSAKTEPIHGFLLALNNCLSYDIIKKFIEEHKLQEIIDDSIDLCFNCIDLMLKHLSKSSIDSSPSFQEMCESLETIMNKEIDRKEDNFDDISSSNDFQLLLSMCWLTIKECSFLLSNFVQMSQHFEKHVISDSTILKIGSQLINILSKCRHKGVIEATCIALTSFTVSLIKDKTRNKQYIEILSQLLSDSMNCITKSALISSITRKSAGLALTIQAILSGESEAFSDGFKLDKSLFSQTIDQLIETANSKLPQDIDIKSDLPQTYALHILQSIVSTASLSRFTIKIVEFLLPVCIKGFSSNIWQIRNASLQLFGSCCCRMLGQRKMSDLDQFMTEGSTITSSELFSRYPTLLDAFKIQFERSFEKMENGFFSTELVPVLSLFASFSPICLGEPYSDRQIICYLIRLLCNKIWKIRMLSAKALSCLLPINQLQKLLMDLSSQQNLDCNSIHGLMLSVNHLLELKQQNKDKDFLHIRDHFSQIFQKFINNQTKCYILNDVFQQIFSKTSLPIIFCDQELENQMPIEKRRQASFTQFLDEVRSEVEFNKSDDIRLFATNYVKSNLKEIISDLDNSVNVFKLVDIILVILEDEDRVVRTGAEEVVSQLVHSNETNFIINFNVAIDYLLVWLTQNPLISPQEITDYLFGKLESSLSLSALIDCQLRDLQVLFEKEEKNVFAEPLFQMFKFSECLKNVLIKHSTQISETSLQKLAKDCDYFLEQLTVLEIENLVTFSIWKLPKLFICLNSLYLRTDVLFDSLLFSSNEKKISSIVQPLDGLSLNQNKFIDHFNGILTTEQLRGMSRTHSLLSTKFKFLSFLKQKSLFKISFK